MLHFRKILEKHIFHKEEHYENFLDDPHSTLWIQINRGLTILVFIFMMVMSFESIWNNAILYKTEIFLFDACISLVFAVEYFYRFVKSNHKFKFPFSANRIVDLLSFLPFFLGLLAAGNFLVLLRLLRILRVLRLVEKIPLTAWFVKSLKDYLDEYRAVFLLFFITLFIWSFFVYYAEQSVIWTQFTSIPLSLWWGLVTMTTVWYWDMVPMSTLGKLFGAILVFLWPLLLALTSAVTIMVFTEAARNHNTLKSGRIFKSKLCTKCAGKNRNEANYCSTCWEKFD